MAHGFQLLNPSGAPVIEPGLMAGFHFTGFTFSGSRNIHARKYPRLRKSAEMYSILHKYNAKFS